MNLENYFFLQFMLSECNIWEVFFSVLLCFVHLLHDLNKYWAMTSLTCLFVLVDSVRFRVALCQHPRIEIYNREVIRYITTNTS